MSKRAVVVLSGGQDSTTCLFWAIHKGYDVIAVTINYGQRHVREIESARQVARLAGVQHHEIIDVGPILRGTSPLVSNASLDQYEGPYALPGGLEKTFVPMRNQLFLTLAANRAYCANADTLITGVCQEDFGGYPDCRQVFIDAVAQASTLGTFTGGEDGVPGPLRIVTPLMNLTKAESVHLALSLKGCYTALAYSHTAYDGNYPPIGADHATLLRAKGFIEAGVPDPLILRAVREGLMRLPATDNYAAGVVDVYNDILDKGL